LPYTSSPATNEADAPASNAEIIIFNASAGLVSNTVSAGTPAPSRRPGSSIQLFGTYRARSINACPRGVAYVK